MCADPKAMVRQLTAMADAKMVQAATLDPAEDEDSVLLECLQKEELALRSACVVMEAWGL